MNTDETPRDETPRDEAAPTDAATTPVDPAEPAGPAEEAPAGPPPRPLTEDEVLEILARERIGTLATIKRDGRPHLSNMLFAWDPAARVIRFSTTADRAKPHHVRRNANAALHVSGGNVWSFAVAEGDAEVTEPTTIPGDATGRELLAMVPAEFRPADEATFLAGAVAERRVVIRLAVTRLYGTALDVPDA
ncbi:pyridoxamine 5'-phosphate oxidase family protein [Embleya sp. NPDC059259]|uniref:pyridoxamine 5'-phosphate oxidase family protein n=1 Tax=unclassified Embleya TaxID=2699296 RepID=UPI0036C7B7E0